MEKTFEELIVEIQESKTPGHAASEISYFMNDRLKKGELTLYEAYTLNKEILVLTGRPYTQIAWKNNASGRDCIRFINQILLAVLFDELEYAESLKASAMETYSFYNKKYSNYIMDDFETYLEAASNEELLKEIAETRKEYDIALERFLADKPLTKEQKKYMDYSEGPYLTEVFPRDYFEPENLILSKETFNEEKKLRKEVEDIILEVAMKW